MRDLRRSAFRVLAILLGLSTFVLFEVVCRSAGWGTEQSFDDAWTEFESVRPLFVKTEDGKRYKVSPNRRDFFADNSFSVSKEAGTKRIFVFGGSTVQGRPFSIPTSFTTFLKTSLNLADTETEWEVINCGGISYASYRLLPIIHECLQYQPDIYIVCTGHNEFLECVTYADVRTASPLVVSSHKLLDNLNSYRLLRQCLSLTHQSKNAPQAIRLPQEVDAMLDHQGGLDAYSRDALHRSQIEQQFEINLKTIVRTCRNANVPLLLLSPPLNLCDCPPFKSEFGAATSENVRSEITSQLPVAAKLMNESPTLAIEQFRQLSAMDREFAFSWYQLGQALMLNHQPEAAALALSQAVDEDVCPLRMTSQLRSAMETVATTENIPFLDLHQRLAEECQNGIVGDAILVDHVHPSFRGHQLIALTIADRLHQLDLAVVTDSQWRSKVQLAFDQHLQSLDDLYFLRGRRTLENLRAWTAGRADGPPIQLQQGTNERPSETTR